MIIRLLTALLFNSFVGCTISVAFGADPLASVVGFNAVGFALSFAPMPKGALFDTMVYTEMWEIEMVKDLNSEPSFLEGVKEKEATNNSIKMKDLGVEPGVLIDNDSYPIPAVRRTDNDRSIDLHKFQTEVTEITDDELYSISYDKIKSVNEDHKSSLKKGRYARAIYNISPNEAVSKKMPVLIATGDPDATGRKTATPKDVIRLRGEFTDMGINEDEELRLVLNSAHWLDLMLADERFTAQFMNIRTGELLPLYGFNIYKYSNMPYFFKDAANANKWTRKSFGVIPGVEDCLASIAFYKPRIVQSTGDTKFYHKKAEPRTQQNEINYRHYHLATRKAFDGVAALVSEKS